MEWKYFIKELLSNQDNVSTKRLSGMALILSYIIMSFISLFVTITKITHTMAEAGLYSGIFLLTGSAIEKLWKK